MSLEKRTKIFSTIAVISTFVMVFLPVQVAIPFIKQIIIAVAGGSSILFQILILVKTKEKDKRIQAYILLFLTITALILMIFLYTDLLGAK